MENKTSVELLLAFIENVMATDKLHDWQGLKRDAITLERNQLKAAYDVGFLNGMVKDRSESSDKYYEDTYGKQI